MAFSINDLATELGIDPSTLTPDAVTKWNGYLSEADSKYTSATQAAKDAEENLRLVQEEQRVINERIESFGMTEANVAALRANNAAMEASLKTLKEQGFDVNIPVAPVVNKNESAQFDPKSFQQDVNSTLVQGFNVMNRYQRLHGGQPMPDDIDVLAREAAQARKPFQQYVSEKYDFAGKEKAMQAEATAKRDAEVAAKAVKDYQEKNPVTAGNPELHRGVASRFPQIAQKREGVDKNFANMPARQKIAQSLSRSRTVLANAS